MISLETARKLKDAGLRWEPKVGDWYYEDGELHLIGDIFRCRWAQISIDHADALEREGPIFAPRLDQSLAEIEKRGYFWDIYRKPSDEATIMVYSGHDYNPDSGKGFYSVLCETTEEAAAQALLWILEQKGGR